MTAPHCPLPPFSSLSSRDGVLNVTWAARDGARAAVIVALRAVDEALAHAFWAGELDNDLIRQPVDASKGSATLYVPAGRLLHVALVIRGADGELITCLPVAQAKVATEPPPALEDPVCHDTGPSQATPLVFAHGDTPAGFRALARRVAAQASGDRAAESQPAPISGFGARQRWTLTRLQWPRGEGPLAIVIRDQFIDAPTLASWSDALPHDARQIDATCDSLVDAEPPQDSLRFYAILRGPTPWRALALSPVPPPFDTTTRPHVMGELSARLGEGITDVLQRLETEPLALSDLEPQLTMLRGAVDVLDPLDPLRALVQQATERWRAGERT